MVPEACEPYVTACRDSNLALTCPPMVRSCSRGSIPFGAISKLPAGRLLHFSCKNFHHCP